MNQPHSILNHEMDGGLLSLHKVEKEESVTLGNYRLITKASLASLEIAEITSRS